MKLGRNIWIGMILSFLIVLTMGMTAYAAETSKISEVSDAAETPEIPEVSDTAETSATSDTILRVAYCPLHHFFDYDEAGHEVGYGVDVLDKISQYTGIEFQYVKADSWEDTKQMLLSGEADIRMPGTMPSTPSTTLSYSTTSILDTYEVMLSLKSRDDLFYQDYDKIHTLKIAIVDSFYDSEDVEKYLADIGVSQEQLVFCTEYNDCYDKLKAGEVDALITNIVDMTDDMKMLARFNSISNYITTVIDSPYMTEINDAIAEIKIEEPTFFSTLYETWFPDRVTIPLTLEESEYLAGIDTLTFAFREDEGFLSHLRDGAYYGIYVDQAKLICEKLGKKFRAVSLEECLDGTEQADIYAGFFYDRNYAREWNYAISSPIRDINYYIIQKKEKSYDPATCKIAAIAKFKYTKDYLETQYKDAKFQYYDTYEECLQAVENNQADITIINNYIAEYYLGMYQYSDLSARLSDDYSHMFCFATEEDHAILASILSKGLTMISDKEISETYISGQEDKAQTQLWQGILYKNPLIVAVVAAAVAALIIAIIMLVLFTKRQQKQNQKLEEALSVKSNFMASMSHDMRTPMNGILGMIRLSRDSSDVNEIHTNMEKAESAGEYMLNLINDTLDLQRMESKKLKLNYEVVHVSEYYDSVFGIMKSMAEEKRTDLEIRYIGIDQNGYVKLDPLRIKQILANLVSNAVKFTPEGGSVVVSIEALGEDAQVLHRKYEVRDTGVGMSADFVKNRLFKAYAQENNQVSSQLTGSGLGMAITKNLVDLMGGRIEVESEPGEGTTFTVYLDIEKATASMMQQADTKSSLDMTQIQKRLSGKRILLVEDHPLNAEIAKKLLWKVGCLVTWEQDGKLGVDRFEDEGAHAFDLILMDIRMPHMDGLEAARTIRALEQEDAKLIPIVAMTANAYEADIQNCLDAGMNAHIAKPVNPQKMYEVLVGVLE